MTPFRRARCFKKEDFQMFDSMTTALRQVRRIIATATAAAAIVFGVASAQAQAPAPAQAPAQQRPAAPAPARPAAPAPARPAAPAPAQQRPAQAAPAAPAQQQAAPPQQAQGDQPQLIYSPWAKFCNKAPDPGAKQVCFTGRDARTEAGVPVVAAALIEPEGEPKKILRVTLPSPLQLQYGTRILIDQNQPLASPFFTCFANGCMADYEGTPDLIQKLKAGQTLQVQAINLGGNQVGFPVPLADFKKVNEGAAMDPKKYEEDQKKVQDELQKKADDLRKKLEQQAPPPAAGASAPGR
jgi:invasion protein IalB